MTVDRKPLSSFWTPRYWPTWFGMGLLRLVCLLPHRAALAFGRVIGRLAHRLGGSRRAVVRRNIELCFPELTAQKRDALAYEHFKALGMTVIEMGLGRWASDGQLTSITTINGLEHLQAAVEEGQGIILLAAHFTTIEISGRVLALPASLSVAQIVSIDRHQLGRAALLLAVLRRDLHALVAQEVRGRGCGQGGQQE